MSKILHNKKRTKSKTNPRYKFLICYLITIFIIIFPFITYIHLELLKGKSLEYFSNNSGYIVDFFLFSKEMVLICFAVFIALFFISEHIFPDNIIHEIPLKSKHARYPIIIFAGYAILILISCIMSKEKDTVLFGISSEYEGLFALLSYIILFLAGYNYFNKESFIKLLKIGLIVLMVIISILSLIEYLYKPLYEINFMKYLIAPEKYLDIAESMKNVKYKSQVSLSFYNPGYLGGICAILFPVSLGFAYDENRKTRKILLLILSTGILFSLIVSSSTGALYATIIVTVLFAISMRKSFKIMLIMFELILICVILFFTVNIMSGNQLYERFFKTITHKEISIQEKEKFVLSDMVLKDGILYVSSSEYEFIIQNESKTLTTVNDLLITDTKYNKIPFTITQNTIFLQATGYENVSITVEDGYMSLDCNYDDTIDFYITDQGFKLIGQNGIALDNIPTTNTKKYKDFYGIFTGRGYSWINTVPILKECIIFGKGCGSFIFYFTQYDVVGMMNTHGSYKFILDKPHNWYLQIGVNTGVFSLILLLTLFGRYVFNGVKKYLININYSTFEVSLFFGIVSFMIVGIVNDSSITVNPIFWLLFGVGSYLLSEQLSKENIYNMKS